MSAERSKDEQEILCGDNLPGVIAELGELGPGAVVMEKGLAAMFDRSESSVRRAVDRGELPPPCRLFGKKAWTAGSIVAHIEGRMQDVAEESDQLKKKMARLSL